MPRYFITTNASRNYVAGGITFPFEPVALRGGSWLGVLAVDEESAANILLSAGFEQVAEVDLARYEDIKKKLMGVTSSASPTQPNESRPVAVGPGVAPVAGAVSAHGAADTSDISRNPNSTSGISAISLLSAPVNPPHEPLLEQPSTRRGKPIRRP